MKSNLHLGFACLLMLLAAYVVVELRTSTAMLRTQMRLAEIQGMRLELYALQAAYLDAETGQRGYLLTGDEQYLVPYKAAIEALEHSGGRLKSLLAPQSSLNELHAHIAKLGQEKLDELARTIEVRRAQGSEAALEIVRQNKGKATMDQLRAVVAKLDNGFDLEMRALIAEGVHRRNAANLASGIFTCILGAALVALWMMTAKHAAERERLLAVEHDTSLLAQKALAAERAAHSEAAHANKLKDEFLAVISHELRTPLNAIMGWTSLLREGAQDDAELREGIDTIDRNARAQTRLVDDLLDVSRIISGKVRLQISEVDLRSVAMSAVDGLRPAANARGIKVTLTATPESTAVLGDVDRLQQVVWNLLNNAIKFTPRGGSVEVALSQSDSRAVLEVRDTGQGIRTDFLPRIFDRFSQQDGTTTRGHGGMGLGLAITRHLVELHGGKVQAFSAGEGKGATFRVEIPVVAVRELKQHLAHRDTLRVSTDDPRSVTPVAFDGLKVLAVDDQPDTLAVIRRVLSRAGADVRTAPSVADATSILQEWVPNVIISDIGMPDKDGYAFMRELRADGPEPVRDIPAVALTAFAREADRKAAIDAGFNDHLAKPVDAVALVEKVAALAGHPA